MRADARARLGLALLLALALLALGAPLVAGYDPIAQTDLLRTRFAAPLARDAFGGFHLLGTDRLGRDVWSRLVYGARISLATGVLATVLSVAIGVAVGLGAAVLRGPARSALLALTDFALALPRVVLLLLLAALWSPSAALVVIVLGLTGWMSVARLVYGEAEALLARAFVHSGPSSSPQNRASRPIQNWLISHRPCCVVNWVRPESAHGPPWAWPRCPAMPRWKSSLSPISDPRTLP